MTSSLSAPDIHNMVKILKFDPDRLKAVPRGLRWVRRAGPMAGSEPEKDGIAETNEVSPHEVNTTVVETARKKHDHC